MLKLNRNLAASICIGLMSLAFSEQLFAAGTETSASGSNATIEYWNRSTARLETELVYDGGFLQWIYGTRTGRFLDYILLSRLFTSELCGAYQSSSYSKKDILPFVKKLNIQMDQFEDAPYSCFNDFFIRKFKPDQRKFTTNPLEIPAYAEARYFAYEKILPDQKFPVKGKTLPAGALLGSDEKARPFLEGPMLIARLSPIDYHRFHFPDDGKILETYTIPGPLHSVNPIALRQEKEILLQNERQVTIIETAHFGKIAYVEVGAMCVGKIVQTPRDSKTAFSRGDEKGYFLFGGSTVIVLGQPGVWKPDADLIENTAKGIETLVQLGTKVGSIVPPEVNSAVHNVSNGSASLLEGFEQQDR